MLTRTLGWMRICLEMAKNEISLKGTLAVNWKKMKVLFMILSCLILMIEEGHCDRF